MWYDFRNNRKFSPPPNNTSSYWLIEKMLLISNPHYLPLIYFLFIHSTYIYFLGTGNVIHDTMRQSKQLHSHGVDYGQLIHNNQLNKEVNI